MKTPTTSPLALLFSLYASLFLLSTAGALLVHSELAPEGVPRSLGNAHRLQRIGARKRRVFRREVLPANHQLRPDPPLNRAMEAFCQCRLFPRSPIQWIDDPNDSSFSQCNNSTNSIPHRKAFCFPLLLLSLILIESQQFAPLLLLLLLESDGLPLFRHPIHRESRPFRASV